MPAQPPRIYRHPASGIYWLQWRGKHSLKTRDAKIASARAAEIQRQQLDPGYRPPDETTLATALTDWREQQAARGRSAATLKSYPFRAAHLVRLLGRDRPLRMIDAAAIDGYLRTRHAEGAAPATRWYELCALRGALKLARRHRRYPYALDEVMPETFTHASPPGTRHLLLPDVLRLVEALPKERADVVRFLVATGADWVGVERAEAGCIDREVGLVRIYGSKTAFRARVVPILGIFAPLLAEVSPPFAPWGNVRRDLEVACTRAGVGEECASRPGRRKITPRDLRRSHSRILRAAGVEPSLIAPMLGHADGRMVERVYGRIEPQELAAAIERRLNAAPLPRSTPDGRRSSGARRAPVSRT